MNNKVAVFGQRRAGVYLLSEIYNPDDVKSSVQNINKVIPAIGSLVVDDTVGNHNTIYVVYSVDAVTHRSTLVNASILDTTDGVSSTVAYGNEGYMLFYKDEPTPFYYKTKDHSLDKTKRYYIKDSSDNYILYTGESFANGIEYYELRLLYEVAVDSRISIFSSDATSFAVYKTAALNTIEAATPVVSQFYKDDDSNYVESILIPLEHLQVPMTDEIGETNIKTAYYPKVFYTADCPTQGDRYVFVAFNNNKAIAQVVLEGQPMMELAELNATHRSITKFDITANQYDTTTGTCYLVRGQNPEELIFYAWITYADGEINRLQLDHEQFFAYGLDEVDTNIVGSVYPITFKYFIPAFEQVNNSSGRNYDIGPTKRYITKTIDIKIYDSSLTGIAKISPIFTFKSADYGYQIIPLVYFANMEEPQISYYDYNVSQFNVNNLNSEQAISLQCWNEQADGVFENKYKIRFYSGPDNNGVWYTYRDYDSSQTIRFGDIPRPKLIQLSFIQTTDDVLDASKTYYTYDSENDVYNTYTGSIPPSNEPLYENVESKNYYKLYTMVDSTETDEKAWFLKTYYYNACPPVPYGQTTQVVPTHFQIRAVDPAKFMEQQNEISTIPVVTYGPISIDEYFNSSRRAFNTTINLDLRSENALQPPTAIVEFLLKESPYATEFKTIYGVGVDVIVNRLLDNIWRTVYVSLNGDDQSAVPNSPYFATVPAALAVNPERIIIQDGDYSSDVVFENVPSVIQDGNFRRITAAGTIHTGQGQAIPDRGSSSSPSNISLTVYGGTFNDHLCGSDYSTVSAIIRYGNIFVTIKDGRYHQETIIGPAYEGSTSSINHQLNGSIELTITGGIFDKPIICAGYAAANTATNRTHLIGNVRATLDVSNNGTIKLAGLVLGANGHGDVTGNTVLIITGNGLIQQTAYTGQGKGFMGGSAGDQYQVTGMGPDETSTGVSGTRSLQISAFTGTLEVRNIQFFQNIEITSNSKFNLPATEDLTHVYSWKISYGSEIRNSNFACDWTYHNLVLEYVPTNLSTDWVIISNSNLEAFENFDKTTVKINGISTEYKEDGYFVTTNTSGTKYKLAIVGVTMVLSKYVEPVEPDDPNPGGGDDPNPGGGDDPNPGGGDDPNPGGGDDDLMDYDYDSMGETSWDYLD